MALVYSPEVPSGKATPQDAPPSPTLTNPDMILPRRPYSGYSSSPSPDRAAIASSPTLRHADFILPTSSSPTDASAEIGVATTVKMPIRAKPLAPSSQYSAFVGYEHGAPLSDIGEEETIASLTPRSKATRQSRSPSPAEQLTPSPAPYNPDQEPSHERRNSIAATSDGSEDVDWETFDTSKMMSGRLAADVAKEQERDALENKRNSMISNADIDELMLNDRAEKILEDARKRLTHMEDNLSKARHSTLWSPRSSPNISDYHHPAGNLYRSISLAGTGKRYSRPVKGATSSSPTHARGSSDTTPTSGLKRLSLVPEARASSAQGYTSKSDSPQYYSRSSPVTRMQSHSPSSSQGVNSPLRILEEEEDDSDPSTSKTSPETHGPKGLGIDTMAPAPTSERKFQKQSPTLVRSASAASLGRPESAASTRSIRESMTDLRLRIHDLKAKTQADQDRRRNVQNRNTPSPFTHANPEKWYTTAPEYNQPGSPINANAGEGWSPNHARSTSLDAQMTPQTPKMSNYLQPETPSAAIPLAVTPTGRTDVNTPNLVRQNSKDPPNARDSVLDESQYEDAAQEFDEEEQVAASEEEQVYLNEVLEESLQDVEPGVPDIPEHLLQEAAAERHEDRLDAFDYENMFLHSAMGNYRRSVSTDSDTSDAESVETSRADQITPTAERPDGHSKEATLEPAIELGEDEIEDDDDTELAEELPTPKVLVPPPKPWLRSSRSNSVESVSTQASFATATEGGHQDDSSDDEDDTPHQILGWGSDPTFFPSPPISSPRREHAPAQNFPTPPTSVRVVSPTNSQPGQQSLNINTQRNGIPTPVRSPANSISAGSTISQPRSQRSLPSTAQQLQSYHQHQHTPSRASSDHPANTEILMESLIKLADPDFKVDSPSVASNRSAGSFGQSQQQRAGTFADVDKDLVLALLREVGQVCNGVLLAERRRDGGRVKELRERLERARGVLEGDAGAVDAEGVDGEDKSREQ